MILNHRVKEIQSIHITINHKSIFLFISVVKIYATAQLTPRAVPIAANTAEARFHRNFISLALFSFVIILSSIILIVLNLLGTEIHGFFKDTAWLRIDIPRHFVITACFASSRLSYIFQYFNFSILQFQSRVYTLVQLKCKLSHSHRAAQPCLF